MAIVNRDKNVTEQIENFPARLTTAGSSIAVTYHVAQAPFPGTLRYVEVAANAISNAPVLSVSVKRNTSGGVTTIPYVGTTLAVVAYGISYPYQGFSLAAPGSTLLNLLAGDVVVVVQEIGATMAVTDAVISVGIQATQDYKEHFGISS